METIKPLFAPVRRADRNKIMEQAGYFESFRDNAISVEHVPDSVVILNAQRQIVFANRHLQSVTGMSPEEILSLRPGEVFDCIHSHEPPEGCGTTESCSTCGAAKAIFNCQQGQTDVQECRIISKGQAFDLRVCATPAEVRGENFVVFVISDTGNEKRRIALEHIFFHDVLNTAAGIKGLVDIFHMIKPEEMQEYNAIISQLTERLIDEIRAQKLLAAAENNELILSKQRINSRRLLEDICGPFATNPDLGHLRIVISEDCTEREFVSDPVILSRILHNILKNAVEATKNEGTILLGCTTSDNTISFSIHNPSYIPREIQMQIFQRSFSTKGLDRGLGTYSIKLLSERYLHGKVSFVSTPGEGTTFCASYPLET
ncbi:MAG: PAS domain-containing sensor histidine kinase [Bacteroidota bacterium]